MKDDVKESQPTYKWKLEKDIDMPMRDGTMLKADVFRPDSDEKFPVILNMGIYQKDKLWVPPHDLEEKAQSLHELGDGQSGMVVSARLCVAAHRRARLAARRPAS